MNYGMNGMNEEKETPKSPSVKDFAEKLAVKRDTRNPTFGKKAKTKDKEKTGY